MNDFVKINWYLYILTLYAVEYVCVTFLKREKFVNDTENCEN